MFFQRWIDSGETQISKFAAVRLQARASISKPTPMLASFMDGLLLLPEFVLKFGNVGFGARNFFTITRRQGRPGRALQYFDQPGQRCITGLSLQFKTQLARQPAHPGAGRERNPGDARYAGKPGAVDQAAQ